MISNRLLLLLISGKFPCRANRELNRRNRDSMKACTDAYLLNRSGSGNRPAVGRGESLLDQPSISGKFSTLIHQHQIGCSAAAIAIAVPPWALSTS